MTLEQINQVRQKSGMTPLTAPGQLPTSTQSLSQRLGLKTQPQAQEEPGLIESLKETALKTATNIADIETSQAPRPKKAVTGLGELGKGVGEAVVDVAKAIPHPEPVIIPEDIKTKLAQSSVGKSALDALKTTADVAKLWKGIWDNADPETKDLLESALNSPMLLPVAQGVKAGVTGAEKVVQAGVKGAKVAGEAIGEVAQATKGVVTSLFKKKPITVEDAISQADEALGVARTQSVDVASINKKMDQLIAQGKTAEARALAEATAPNVTLKEKLAGLRPDIKQRIQGKPDLMAEYIDVVNTRNLRDTAPSVFEHGGDYARKATDIMKQQLDETGGVIGATRKKLGTIQAPINEVVNIEKSFTGELNKLNLEVRNGQVVQKAGTVSKTGSAGDVKLLQQMYEDLLTVKQSPTLTNLIDFRSGLDARVNFAKQAREVSGSVDPFARQVRKSVADTSAKIVGKTEAGELAKYSDFMDAYNDIKYYTDKNAGGEYLLRLVLSGRGGDARKIIQTIKENTSIDLMDHATMMQVTNEMLGNAAQKNLFRQEMTNAGLDVSALLKGDPRGAAMMLFDKTVDRFIDPEKILREASQVPKGKGAAATPKTAITVGDMLDSPIGKIEIIKGKNDFGFAKILNDHPEVVPYLSDALKSSAVVEKLPQMTILETTKKYPSPQGERKIRIIVDHQLGENGKITQKTFLNNAYYVEK